MSWFLLLVRLSDGLFIAFVSYDFDCILAVLINLIKLGDAYFVWVIFDILSFVVLPDKFFELREVTEQRNASSSVEKGGFEYPKIGVVGAKECFRADWFAIKVSLWFFMQLLSW